MTPTPMGGASVSEVLEAGCDCVTATDKMLVEHNATVVTTLGLFGAPRRVSLEVEKLDSKKRGRPPRLIASYCPFCGEKYRSAIPAKGGEA